LGVSRAIQAVPSLPVAECQDCKISNPELLYRIAVLAHAGQGDAFVKATEGEPRPDDVSPRETTLYRVFDAADSLMYVGISSRRNLRRLAEHEHGKPWWTEARRVSLQHFPTREDAAEAERDAIRDERPKYNIAGKGQSDG
jgi:predicted GIY-YIG superfamily endonuclease